jgi:hypothetical protein
MRPVEWVEQIVMILVVIAWIPWIFGMGAAYEWYRIVLYYGTPIPLLIILVNRLLRYRQAVREAEAIAEQRAQVDTDRKLK